VEEWKCKETPDYRTTDYVTTGERIYVGNGLPEAGEDTVGNEPSQPSHVR